MRPSHFTLLAGVLLLAWQPGVSGQSAPRTPTAGQSAVAPEGSHPAAVALLDGTLQKLGRPEGVDVRFRLEFFGRTQPVVTTGRSVTAANQKVMVELETRQVARTGKLRLLCDGETFYRIESAGGQNSYMTYTIRELQAALERLGTTEAERVAREDVEREQQGRHGFEGLSALVKDLKVRMVFAEPQTATHLQAGNKQVAAKVIQGQWGKEVLDLIAPVKKGDSPNEQDRRYLWNEKLSYFYVPRTARLTFDAQSNELLRVDLYAILEKQGPEVPVATLHVESITPVQKVEETWFKPTAAELAYTRVTIDLNTYVRSEHQQTMNFLKAIQEQQSPTASGAAR